MSNTGLTIVKPRLLITSGEPAGIGPDLVIQLSQYAHDYDLTVIADPNLMLDRAKQLAIPIKIKLVPPVGQKNEQENNNAINVLPINMDTPGIAGKLNGNNVNYVLRMLELAAKKCLSEQYDAVITAPIQKSIINDAGIRFSGHTEYFAAQCGHVEPVMLLASPELKVALLTTHLPLHKVPKLITKARLKKTINIVINSMVNQFGMENPAIAVCGLNPHAGENGHLGMEEQTIINPVIKDFAARHHNIVGALPADTAFQPTRRKETDVFICMYHDQGLPVLKTLSFGEAVNVTLGLPIIRTSVDHGTALELAGSGKAECNSLLAAIKMANNMVLHKRKKEIKAEKNGA